MANIAPDPWALRPIRRLTGTMAVGVTLANATDVTETHAVAGAARVQVRLKASVGGTLKLHFMGPDTDLQVNPVVGTEYTTRNPADVTVTANTEAVIYSDCYGEGYVKVIYTPSGAGTMTYADLSQV